MIKFGEAVPLTPPTAKKFFKMKYPIPNRILFIMSEITISSALYRILIRPGISEMIHPNKVAIKIGIIESMTVFPVINAGLIANTVATIPEI